MDFENKKTWAHEHATAAGHDLTNWRSIAGSDLAAECTRCGVRFTLSPLGGPVGDFLVTCQGQSSDQNEGREEG